MFHEIFSFSSCWNANHAPTPRINTHKTSSCRCLIMTCSCRAKVHAESRSRRSFLLRVFLEDEVTPFLCMLRKLRKVSVSNCALQSGLGCFCSLRGSAAIPPVGPGHPVPPPPPLPPRTPLRRSTPGFNANATPGGPPVPPPPPPTPVTTSGASVGGFGFTVGSGGAEQTGDQAAGFGGY